MKTLFINACIRENSRTLSLCREYISRRCEGEVRELELAGLGLQPFDLNMLTKREADIAAEDFSDREYDLVKEFVTADEIVIAAPFWDFSFPAMLKVYLEHICVNKVAFKYVDGRPVGLCRARKLSYFVTAGGFIGENSSLEKYLEEMCNLLGIPEVRLYKAEGLDIYGNDVDEILGRTIREF